MVLLQGQSWTGGLDADHLYTTSTRGGQDWCRRQILLKTVNWVLSEQIEYCLQNADILVRADLVPRIPGALAQDTSLVRILVGICSHLVLFCPSRAFVGTKSFFRIYCSGDFFFFSTWNKICAVQEGCTGTELCRMVRGVVVCTGKDREGSPVPPAGLTTA